MSHPYADLPSRAFWRSAVSETAALAGPHRRTRCRTVSSSLMAEILAAMQGHVFDFLRTSGTPGYLRS